MLLILEVFAYLLKLLFFRFLFSLHRREKRNAKESSLLILLAPLDIPAGAVPAGDEGAVLAHALDQDAAAVGALAGHGLIPADKIAVGVVGAAEEGLALLGVPLEDVAAALGTGHLQLLQQGLGVSALGEVGANNSHFR